MIERADSDQDGLVTLEDFYNIMTKKLSHDFDYLLFIIFTKYKLFQKNKLKFYLKN